LNDLEKEVENERETLKADLEKTKGKSDKENKELKKKYNEKLEEVEKLKHDLSKKTYSLGISPTTTSNSWLPTNMFPSASATKWLFDSTYSVTPPQPKSSPQPPPPHKKDSSPPSSNPKKDKNDNKE
jgi:hypothetical protein